jgi:catechol 2,3-dioxygenase-like lactoylglutathione lyase family enzyme
MGERVTGIGGIFFRAQDPAALAAWYAEHLGVDIDTSYGGASFTGTDGTYAVWSPFPADTDYLGGPAQTFMVNYRVADLDAMLAQLRAAGVRVEDDVEDSESGRFGWAYDLEGTRFELWQPR